MIRETWREYYNYNHPHGSLGGISLWNYLKTENRNNIEIMPKYTAALIVEDFNINSDNK